MLAISPKNCSVLKEGCSLNELFSMQIDHRLPIEFINKLCLGVLRLNNWLRKLQTSALSGVISNEEH